MVDLLVIKTKAINAFGVMSVHCRRSSETLFILSFVAPFSSIAIYASRICILLRIDNELSRLNEEEVLGGKKTALFVLACL